MSCLHGSHFTLTHTQWALAGHSAGFGPGSGGRERDEVPAPEEEKGRPDAVKQGGAGGTLLGGLEKATD